MIVLISPVGKQDPYSDVTGEEGSAVTICRHIKPDLVYLLPTADRADVKDHTSDAAHDTEDWLRTELPAVKVLIKPLDVSDPSDYEQVLPCLHRTVSAIVQELRAVDDCQLYVNTSSSTPQVKTSLMLMVSSGILRARVLQVANPQVMTRAERVREVNAAFLAEEFVIDKIARLYDRYLFTVSAEELRQLAGYAYRLPRRHAASVFALICDAYAALDLLSYHQAQQALEKALKAAGETREYGPVSDLLRQQVAVLRQLGQRREMEDFVSLCDIYHNAWRRNEEENYADVLARCWRTLEGCLYYRLREKHGVEPTKPWRSKNNLNAKRIVSQERMNSSLSLSACLAALRDTLEDDEIRAFLRKGVPAEYGAYQDIGKLWEKLRDARNHSLVAHGMQPVSREMAAQGLYLAGAMLRLCFPERTQAFEEYPFAGAQLAEVGRVALAAVRNQK